VTVVLGDITRLLQAWKSGDPAAIEEVVALLYEELRRLAAYYLQRERPGHTLQATALVHETYLRLHTVRDIDWKTRAHFISVVASLMRQILVDHARRRNAMKRAGEAGGFPAQEATWTDLDVVAVHLALEELGSEHTRPAQIVELRFFGGLTIEEVAEVLELSVSTVEREWRFARAWLSTALAGAAAKS
jgi:RNA polymerase sigma-70 factor, ECF subfamily